MSITVLIIEDSEIDAKIIKEKIKTRFPQSNLLTAASLYEGYKVCKKNNIDLILLDLNLPDGYGAQTVQEIRRFCKSEPIIVLSDMDAYTQADYTKQLGAIDFISKQAINDSHLFNAIANNTQNK